MAKMKTEKAATAVEVAVAWTGKGGATYDLMGSGPSYPDSERAASDDTREAYRSEIETYYGFARAKEALQDEIAHARFLARQGLLLDPGCSGSDPRAVAWRGIHGDNLITSLRRIGELEYRHESSTLLSSHEALVELAAVAMRIEVSCALLSQSLGASSVSLVRS